MQMRCNEAKINIPLDGDIIYNIIEHVCVCLFVQPFEKKNTTGAASVKPGEAREMIGAANLRQMKFAK